MNRNNIIEALTKVLSTKKEARSAMETIFLKIKNALRDGDKVNVSGFGSFHSHVMKAKRVRNPKTGVMMNVPPRKKVRFRQAKDFFS